MAFPSSFDEENCVLEASPGTTFENCEALSVLCSTNQAGVPVVVSCWKFSREEMDEINRTGRVWLVIGGASMPAAYLMGMSPFVGDEKK